MKRIYFLLFILIILTIQLHSSPIEKVRSNPDLSLRSNSKVNTAEIDLRDIRLIPDLYFECFIAEISESCEIQIFFDPLVREYIEIYLMERSKQVPLLDARSQVFFPLFEKCLSEFNLPQELKYLPVIESGLECKALSPSGALGLWQFLPETGRSCGLTISKKFDERVNPEQSTFAACKYLTYLYNIFGSWQLCLLAYHAGPTTIKNAILKADGKTNYKDIFPYLPTATQRYIPAYIASMYVLTNYKKHF